MLIALVSGAAVAYFSIQNGTIEGGWQKDGLKEGAARVMFGFFAGILAYQLRPKTPAASWWSYILLAGLAISLMEPIQTNVWGQLALAIVFFPALVWLGSAVRETPFMARAGAFLGALSYPVYILHWPFVDVTRNLFRMIDPADQWFLVWAVIQLALVISIAWFALKLFDEPVRASLMRRLRWSSFLHKPAASHAPST
jgi:peptidoglycan/LPS O-acetylase OafA/YrhL